MVWDFWTPLPPHTFSYLRDKCVSCQRKTSTCSCSCYVYRLINQNNKHQLLLSHALNYISTLASKPRAYNMSNPWWLNFTTLHVPTFAFHTPLFLLPQSKQVAALKRNNKQTETNSQLKPFHNQPAHCFPGDRKTLLWQTAGDNSECAMQPGMTTWELSVNEKCVRALSHLRK